MTDADCGAGFTANPAASAAPCAFLLCDVSSVAGDAAACCAQCAAQVVGSACSATVGAPYAGVLNSYSESNWFSFAATAGSNYILFTMLETLANPGMELLDTDGTT